MRVCAPHSRRIRKFDIFTSQPLARTVLTCRQPLKLSKVNIHQSSPYHDQDQPKYLLTYLTFKWSNENGTQKLPLFFFFFFRKHLCVVYIVVRALCKIGLRQGHASYMVTGGHRKFQKIGFLRKIRISGFQEIYDPHSRRILNFDIYASEPLAKRVLTCRHPLKLSKVNIH